LFIVQPFFQFFFSSFKQQNHQQNASPPDFSMVDMSKPYDPIWPVMVGVDAMKKTDLRCALACRQAVRVKNCGRNGALS
jgi:hypothetical protein